MPTLLFRAVKGFVEHTFALYVCPQLTDRRVSLGDADWTTAKVTGTKTLARLPKPSDQHKAPAVQHRRTSVDVCLPHRSTSPGLSRHLQPMPLPVPPQGGSKTLNKRPVGGGEGLLPSNLLNELNLVLSKTGRKNSD